MADLIAVMSAGELQQCASPDEIYERPANRFVATFVGNPPMNVLKAALLDDGVQVAGAKLPLDATRQAACKAAGVTEIGVRPEDLRFVEAGGTGVLGGEVYVVEPMGNETLVEVRAGGQRLSVRAGRGFTAAIGSKIGVAFDPANASFFNAAGSTVVHRVENRRG